MACDGALADRIRAALVAHDGVREQEMFGGIAFLVGGRTAAGIIGDELMVRVGPEAHDAAVARPHARPMGFTGRPLRRFVSLPLGAFATTETWRAGLRQGWHSPRRSHTNRGADQLDRSRGAGGRTDSHRGGRS